MEVKQIYSLVNSISNEIWGTAAPAVKDMSGIIALGNTIGANGTWTVDADKFLNKLVDRIGKTVIRTIDRRVDLKNFIMQDFEFGAILQKVDIQPLQARKDSSWEIGENDFSSVYLDVYKPNVDNKLFSTITTWTVKLTVPDRLYRSAFTGEAGMVAFINGMIGSMSGDLESQINKMNHMCLCNFIAEKKKNSNNIINLVTLYNTTFGYTSESAGYQPIGGTALFNKDFLKFATREINNYVKFLADESARYNIGGKIRATSRDNMHCIMLTDFSSSVASYLESDTYHNEMVALPLYDEINYMQYTGGTFDYRGGVVMIPSSEEGEDSPTTQTIGNVIGVLADRQALGTTITERWSASDRFNSERRTNYTTGANIGFFNDLSENFVCFTLN